MPSYYKPGTRKGNRTYVVRGRIDGAAYEIVTPSLNQSGAEDHWSEFKRTIRAQCGAAAQVAAAPTFADAVALYKQIRETLSANELYYLRRLEARLGREDLAGLTETDIQSAAHALYPGALPQTKNRQAIAPANAVLHVAAKAKLCPRMQVARFGETHPDRPVSLPEQAEIAIKAARAAGDLELAALLTTLAYQGWRIGETLAVELARIDWRRAALRRFVAKSRRWRETPLDAGVLRAWRAWLKARPAEEARWRETGHQVPQDGRLFLLGSRSGVYKRLARLGLAFHYRPHMSRRGFATALKAGGADAIDIRDASSWEDTRSVDIYIADDVERARGTLARLRPARAKRKTRRTA